MCYNQNTNPCAVFQQLAGRAVRRKEGFSMKIVFSVLVGYLLGSISSAILLSRAKYFVDIRKTENGYEVVCRVSGGDVTLLSFTLYAPDAQQAEVIKRNFLSYPRTVYKTMLGLMTKDIENVGGALEEVYGTLV